MRILHAALALATFALHAHADEARDLVTRAKLETELGNYGVASTLYEKAAGDSAAPPALRWEASTRLGMLRSALGDRAGAATAFDRIATDFPHEPAALRYLVQALSGVTLPDARWSLIQGSVRVVTEARDPRRPIAAVAWPDVDLGECRPPAANPPVITIDFKDADLADAMHFFSEFSGVAIHRDACLQGIKITIRMSQVPWDQALRDIVGAFGLTCRYADGVGFQIGCGAGSTGPAAGPEEAEEEPVATARAEPATSHTVAELSLQGIVIVPGSPRYAILLAPGNKAYNLAEGAALADGRVKSISKLEVVFALDGGGEVVKTLGPRR